MYFIDVQTALSFYYQLFCVSLRTQVTKFKHIFQ